MNDKGLHPEVILSVHSAFPQPSTAQKPRDWHLSESEWTALIETAAHTMFEMMLGSSVTRAQDASTPEGDMTAMVGLAGELCGVLSVKCTSETAGLLASKMLGDAAQGEAAARDALGEIANVVAGGLKTKVQGSNSEDTCFLSTPTVVIGHNFKIYSLGASMTVEVPLDIDSAARVWFILDVHHSAQAANVHH